MMWIVEPNVFGSATELELLDALQRLGCKYEVVDSAVRIDDSLVAAMSGLHASCWFVLQASKSVHWPRSQWGHPDDFAVSRYRQQWSQWLLNEDSEALSLANFVWDHDRIWREWQNDNEQVFVRPDDGFKSFTGVVLRKDELAQWWDARQAFMTPTNEIVWVARPVTIAAEYRCFVNNGRVCAMSQYRPVIERGIHPEVIDFVESVVAQVRPTMTLLAVDVARESSGLKIIEIGCAPCVDFYASDLPALIQAMTP